MISFSKIKDYTEMLFMKRVLEDLGSDDRSGIHTSDILNCLRRAYYDVKDRKEGKQRALIQRDAITFWLGKIIHVLPMSNVVITGYGKYRVIRDYKDYEHKVDDVVVNGIKTKANILCDKETGEEIGVWGYELPVYYCMDDEGSEYSCVRGRLDELVYVPTVGLVLIDKKSASEIPKRPSDRYIEQVTYYWVMLEQSWGIKADVGEILYIRKSWDEDWKHYVEGKPFNLTGFEEVEGDLYARLSKLRTALETDVPPKPEFNFFCSNCPHYSRCVEDGLVIEDRKTKEGFLGVDIDY